jgi:hypothetical protein
LNRQLINHLPLREIFRVENGTSNKHCRSDDPVLFINALEIAKGLRQESGVTTFPTAAQAS